MRRCKRILFWRHRPDGDLIRPRDAVQKLMPHIIRTRTESCIYYHQQLDLSKTLEFINTFNAGSANQRLTVFSLIVTAMVRTAVQYPRLNRFIAGRKLYARNSLQISYVVKRDLSIDGTETLVKQVFSPQDTIHDIVEKLGTAVQTVRDGQNTDTDGLMNLILKFPGFLITWIICLGRFLNYTGLMPAAIIHADPLCTSAFVANLGSIGAGAPFHHLYEWGTASLFLVIGKYKEISDQTGTKTTMEIAFTIDERIADGFYFARAVQYFQGLMENPELLIPQRGVAFGE